MYPVIIFVPSMSRLNSSWPSLPLGIGSGETGGAGEGRGFRGGGGQRDGHTGYRRGQGA